MQKKLITFVAGLVSRLVAKYASDALSPVTLPENVILIAQPPTDGGVEFNMNVGVILYQDENNDLQVFVKDMLFTGQGEPAKIFTKHADQKVMRDTVTLVSLAASKYISDANTRYEYRSLDEIIRNGYVN